MGIKVVATNRKATHNYKILEKVESGLVLTGTEVKSIRNNKVSIKESYVRIIKNEIFIIGMNIGSYENAGYSSHEPISWNFSKVQINKFRKLVDEKGRTLVPLKIYFKNGLVKLEFGLGQGKKLYDKRHDIKDKQLKRRIDRNIKDFS